MTHHGERSLDDELVRLADSCSENSSEAEASALHPTLATRPSKQRLLLWGGCALFAFWIQQQAILPGFHLVAPSWETTPHEAAALYVAEAIVSGLSVSGTLLLIVRAIRESVLPKDAGAWLVVAGGVFNASIWIQFAVWIVAGFGSLMSTVAWSMGGGLAICCGLLAWGGYRCRSERAWAGVLIACAVGAGVMTAEQVVWRIRLLSDAHFETSSLPSTIYKAQMTLVVSIALIFGVIGIVKDWRLRRPRTWVHWAGLAWGAASLLMPLFHKVLLVGFHL